MSHEELAQRVCRIIAANQHLTEDKVTPESTFAELNVLSYAEIPARVEVQSAAIIPVPEI